MKIAMRIKASKQDHYIKQICALLILLWAYVALSKILDLGEFKRQLYNQVFSRQYADLLIWILPIVEIVTALLLLFRKSRLLGLFVSSMLMLLFTVYVGLVLVNYFERRPCACGGVLKELGWQLHFWFNLFFLAVSSFGVWLAYQSKYFNKHG